MTNDQINLNSQDFRMLYRPAPATREQQAAKIRQYLVEMAYLNWTATYRAQAAKLAELEAAGMENFGGYKLLVEMLATVKASAE